MKLGSHCLKSKVNYTTVKSSEAVHHCNKNCKAHRGDTTGDFKCREVKLDFAEIDQCKPVHLGLSLAGYILSNHFCPSMGPNGGSVATYSDLR